MFSRICSLIAIFAMVLIYVGTASAYKFYIDAEEPSTPVKAPFELKKDKADAFGGGYLVAPQGAGNDGNAIATYNFPILNAGKYRFWGRVIATDGGNDSFFWGIDIPTADQTSGEKCGGKMPGDQKHIWDTTNPIASWGWSKMDSRNCAGTDGADQLVVDLTPGDYTLYIIQREDGTELDGILITDQDLTPDQLPTTDAEAQALVSVEAKGKLATAWGAIKAQR